MSREFFPFTLILLAVVACADTGSESMPETEPVHEPYPLRVATFNIEDLRTEELKDPECPRARAAAAIIQRLRPDVILIGEMVYDQPGAPGWEDGDLEGSNGRRFADSFLAVSQGEGLELLSMQAFMAPTNTGIASGLDLDNSGEAIAQAPELPPVTDDAESRRQTTEGREYGGDTWGFGTFPGQYAMALLVRDDLEILIDQVRTFRELPWSAMPGALVPLDPETQEPWYSEEEWMVFRLSSKSHWDVPVKLPNGSVLHLLASHPTPPAFDGPEERNRKRNHDEIRLWADYLDGADYLIDDAGKPGGLDPEAQFVILGDLNADPEKGRSYDNPLGKFLLAHPRVQGDFVPMATNRLDDPELAEVAPSDTSSWNMRIDYVLPAEGIEIRGGGVHRPNATDTEAAAPAVSDHFPVWLDLVVPPPVP